MTSSVKSAGVYGIDGFAVDVECFALGNTPKFDIVGLPDTAVKEAYSRIKAAIKSSGFDFPYMSVTVNLAPADRIKQGTAFDLAILIAMLKCTTLVDANTDGKCFAGELSLDGTLRSTRGVLSMCLAARSAGLSEIYVPASNSAEAAVVDGIDVYGVNNISELADHLLGMGSLTPVKADKEKMFEQNLSMISDMCDVKGQENAKLALSIAAAGMHNVLILCSTLQPLTNSHKIRLSRYLGVA